MKAARASPTSILSETVHPGVNFVSIAFHPLDPSLSLSVSLSLSLSFTIKRIRATKGESRSAQGGKSKVKRGRIDREFYREMLKKSKEDKWFILP